jgi:hypothetical protein
MAFMRSPVRSRSGPHQTFIRAFKRPQVLESGRCYGGSIEPFSIERDALRKEQLLESLPLIQRRLNPRSAERNVITVASAAAQQNQSALRDALVDGIHRRSDPLGFRLGEAP